MLSNPEEEEERLARKRYRTLDHTLELAYQDASRLMGFTDKIHDWIKYRNLSQMVLDEKLLTAEQALEQALTKEQIAQQAYNNMDMIVSNEIIRATTTNNLANLAFWEAAEKILHLDPHPFNVGTTRKLRMTKRFVSTCKSLVEKISVLAGRPPVPDAIIRDTNEKRRKFYELYSKYKQVYRHLGRPKEIRKIPCHFKCPISLDIMMNPVYYTKSINTGSHKYIYEKQEIMAWLITRGNTTDPTTREPLTMSDLKDDTELIEKIKGFEADLKNVVDTFELSNHVIINAPDASDDDDNFACDDDNNLACGKKYRKRRQTKRRQTKRRRQVTIGKKSKKTIY